MAGHAAAESGELAPVPHVVACGTVADVEAIPKKLEERQVATGTVGEEDPSTAKFWVNGKTGSWTVTFLNGELACMMIGGENFRPVRPQPPKPPEKDAGL